MSATRRDVMAGMIAGMVAAAAPARAAKRAASGKLLLKAEGALAPAASGRLPLAWHRERISELQALLQGRRASGALLLDPRNVSYFAGLFPAPADRPVGVFVPAEGADIIWLLPALIGDSHLQACLPGEVLRYFDVPQSGTGWVQDGKLGRGVPINVPNWAVDQLKKRRLVTRTVATDTGDLDDARSRWADNFGEFRYDRIDGLCERMRRTKTPEELALWRRAAAVLDQAHAFARDALIRDGRKLTDFELARRAEGYAAELLPPADRAIAAVRFEALAGRSTAEPGSAGVSREPIARAPGVRVSGTVALGGYAITAVRTYLVGKVGEQQRALWTHARDAFLKQQEMLRAGVSCGQVAEAIHRLQREAKLLGFVRHRLGHGVGAFGAEAPYFALADSTLLIAGLLMEITPALYDPATGFGAVFSDVFLIQPAGQPAVQMSRLPVSDEWCQVDL